MSTAEDNPAGVGRPIEPGETGCGYTGRTPDAHAPCGAAPVAHLLALSDWPGMVSLPACETHVEVARRAGTVLAEHPYVAGCDDPEITEDHWPEATAAKVEVSPPSGVVFLLWSAKHKMWWRPDARGYTRDVDEAGRYTEADAVHYVVQSAMCGRLTEVTSMVAAPDNYWGRPTGPWWAVNHPGIGVLVYDDEGQARDAAGTAGTLLTRDAPDQSWREVG